MKIISEGPARITKATADTAWRRRQPDQRLIIRDRDCRGLALIVNPTTMTWSYAYRPRGIDPHTGRRWPNKTVTLGNPASLSVDDARKEAHRLKGQAAAGADPAAERKARTAATQRQRAATFGRLTEQYANALPKRPKMRGTGAVSQAYVREELMQLRLATADLGGGDIPVTHLTERDIRALISKGEGVTVARKRYGALCRFFDWCLDAGHVTANPCLLIARSRRPRMPAPRSRYLAPAELALLWEAAEQLSEPVWRDLVRFLIAIPCRRNEATRLDWSHLNLQEGEWRQPGHMTKNRDPHRLHLHPLAMNVLKARQAALVGKPWTGLVFPAPRSGRPVDTFTNIKAALSEATGLKDWTWHDMRRSFASALGEAGIPEAVADAVLNHRQSATRGGVLGVYQRSSRWPEQVAAMQLWGKLLQGAIDCRVSVTEAGHIPATAS